MYSSAAWRRVEFSGTMVCFFFFCAVPLKLGNSRPKPVRMALFGTQHSTNLRIKICSALKSTEDVSLLTNLTGVARFLLTEPMHQNDFKVGNVTEATGSFGNSDIRYGIVFEAAISLIRRPRCTYREPNRAL